MKTDSPQPKKTGHVSQYAYGRVKNSLKQQKESNQSGSKKALRKWLVNTDGAIRPAQHASGLAAIVRDEKGKIRYWWKKRAGGMTNNEAEYAAVIFALEQLLRIQGKERTIEVVVYCDSLLIVNQMQGHAQAHTPAIQKALARLRTLVSRFQNVSFHHVSREQNRLADALAFEAVKGWEYQKPKFAVAKPPTEEPHEDVVEEFFSSWRSL